MSLPAKGKKEHTGQWLGLSAGRKVRSTASAGQADLPGEPVLPGYFCDNANSNSGGSHMAEAMDSIPISEQDLFAGRRSLRLVLERVGWVVLALLLLVGLSSVIGRMVFMVEAQGTANPETVYNAFDIRYVQSALASWLHLLPALVIAVAGPLQFIRAVRKRWPAWHRMAGRCYIVAGLLGAVTGFVIGGLTPFGGLHGPGFNESMATAVFSTYIICTLVSAYNSVRKRDFVRHREWMIRSFTLMMGIATERILLMLLRATTEVDLAVLFGTTFWLAGVINIIAAEVWIRLTRTPGSGAAHWKDLDQRANA